MELRHIALVSEFAALGMDDLAVVSAAIQKQVARDFAPVWEISATVDPFPSLEKVPAGYWPMIVTVADLPENQLGVHSDPHGQPMAWIEYADSWSITASHECLEMLVDPWGNQTRTGRSPDDENARVEYLLEICDPCQDADHAYLVNDIYVSDFYTPSYFDLHPQAGKRYSFSGAIQRPLQVLNGGYLSWRDLQTDDWWQLHGANDRTNLGQLKAGAHGLRHAVNRRTENHLAPTRLTKDQMRERIGSRRSKAREAGKRRADLLRQHTKA